MAGRSTPSRVWARPQCFRCHRAQDKAPRVTQAIAYVARCVLQTPNGVLCSRDDAVVYFIHGDP
eukprot:scaffold13136_cov30-Tisochrysis_lutea.AAC.7